MDPAVKIDDIVEQLEMRFEERPTFVLLDSGRVESASREMLHLAEELDDNEAPDIPDWQVPEYKIAREIHFGRWERLPDPREVDERSMMQEFAENARSTHARVELLDALQGGRTFAHFKSAARRNGLDKAWHACRHDALRRFAISWCEQNGIPWK